MADVPDLLVLARVVAKLHTTLGQMENGFERITKVLGVTPEEMATAFDVADRVVEASTRDVPHRAIELACAMWEPHEFRRLVVSILTGGSLPPLSGETQPDGSKAPHYSNVVWFEQALAVVMSASPTARSTVGLSLEFSRRRRAGEVREMMRLLEPPT